VCQLIDRAGVSFYDFWAIIWRQRAREQHDRAAKLLAAFVVDTDEKEPLATYGKGARQPP
jgi:hypothetical protein